MSKHLDKVLQPDGSYKWELVELRACELYEKDKPPVEEEKPAKRSRKAATEAEPTETPETFEF